MAKNTDKRANHTHGCISHIPLQISVNTNIVDINTSVMPYIVNTLPSRNPPEATQDEEANV